MALVRETERRTSLCSVDCKVGSFIYFLIPVPELDGWKM